MSLFGKKYLRVLWALFMVLLLSASISEAQTNPPLSRKEKEILFGDPDITPEGMRRFNEERKREERRREEARIAAAQKEEELKLERQKEQRRIWEENRRQEQQNKQATVLFVLLGIGVIAIIVVSLKNKSLNIHLDPPTNTNTIESDKKDTSQRIIQLKQLFDSGILSEEEYERKKKELIDEL